MLRHLGRSTHRIAIGNERLLGCENDEVNDAAVHTKIVPGQ
ncbi:MAG: hypothetical protein ACREXU_00695 [Gammaproteobacteria bacterium]